MPLSLRQIEQNSATVTFQVGDLPDQILTVEYYTHKVTDETIGVLMDAQNLAVSSDSAEVQKRLKGLNKTLADLIKDWDYYEDDDYQFKVPITPERMAKIDLKIRASILEAITGNARGPEA